MSKNHSTYERTEIMLSNQVTPFNDSCNIYAPEYRQATYYSYFAKDSDGTKAHDLAFEDILNSIWWRLDRALDLETIEWSAKLGALEALESGTTCIIDHHESPHAI